MISSEDYLKRPDRCPHCGLFEVAADSWEGRHGEVRQEMMCLNRKCRKRWVEVYKLVRIEEVKDNI